MENFLIIQRGEDIGRRYDLDTLQLTIGRGSDNDMVLNDPMVSRYHAVIKRQGNRFTVIDLGSANPVAINDQVLEPGMSRLLQHRDVIFIGKTVFSFQTRDSQRQDQQGSDQAQPARHPAAQPTGATQMMSPASHAPERPAPAPSTPTVSTPLPRTGTGNLGSADEGKTMIGGVFQGSADEGDNDRTMVGASTPQPSEPPAAPAASPMPNFPPPPPPPAPRNEDEEFQTRPGLHAVPPSSATDDQEQDTTIGTLPDDESGDSPTVFIPRERR